MKFLLLVIENRIVLTFNKFLCSGTTETNSP